MAGFMNHKLGVIDNADWSVLQIDEQLISDYHPPNMIISKENKRTIYQNLFKGALSILSAHFRDLGQIHLRRGCSCSKKRFQRRQARGT